MNANLAALRADPLHKVGKSGELDVGGPTAGFPVGFSAMRRTDVETGCAGMNRPAMPTGTQATLQPH
jgi:hypothetical protein